jgi:hypothetical protein
VQQAEIPYEGLRDLSGIALAIDGVNFTASVITLATLKRYAPSLVAAIRRWRLNQSARSMTLTVKGEGIDIKVDLPANVDTQQLLRQLEPLVKRDDA